MLLEHILTATVSFAMFAFNLVAGLSIRLPRVHITIFGETIVQFFFFKFWFEKVEDERIKVLRICVH